MRNVMIYKVFVIYDMKAESYGTPIFMKSKGEFLRSFMDAVNADNSYLNKHPDDYYAFEVGEYDDANGIVVNYDERVSLGCALQYLKRPLPVVAEGAGA